MQRIIVILSFLNNSNDFLNDVNYLISSIFVLIMLLLYMPIGEMYLVKKFYELDEMITGVSLISKNDINDNYINQGNSYINNMNNNYMYQNNDYNNSNEIYLQQNSNKSFNNNYNDDETITIICEYK